LYPDIQFYRKVIYARFINVLDFMQEKNHLPYKCISGVMLARSPPVWLEQRSGLTKDCKHGIYWFSSKNTTLRRRDKEWLAQNQDNLSEWSDTSSRRMLFQWAATIKIKLSMLVKNKTDIIIISLIC